MLFQKRKQLSVPVQIATYDPNRIYRFKKQYQREQQIYSDPFTDAVRDWLSTHFQILCLDIQLVRNSYQDEIYVIADRNSEAKQLAEQNADAEIMAQFRLFCEQFQVLANLSPRLNVQYLSLQHIECKRMIADTYRTFSKKMKQKYPNTIAYIGKLPDSLVIFYHNREILLKGISKGYAKDMQDTYMRVLRSVDTFHYYDSEEAPLYFDSFRYFQRHFRGNLSHYACFMDEEYQKRHCLLYRQENESCD